jgi:hypothetical protein
MKKQLSNLPIGYSKDVKEFVVDREIDWSDVPKLSIVIMIVGSRGASFQIQTLRGHSKFLIRVYTPARSRLSIN